MTSNVKWELKKNMLKNKRNVIEDTGILVFETFAKIEKNSAI